MRVIFDNTVAFFSANGASPAKFDFKPFLGINAAIIDADISKDFENGMIKLQTNEINRLTYAESEKVECFKRSVSAADEKNNIQLNITQAFLDDLKGLYIN